MWMKLRGIQKLRQAWEGKGFKDYVTIYDFALNRTNFVSKGTEKVIKI